MDKDNIKQFQEILSSLHRDESKISDIEKKQDYLQFCIEKLYDKIVDKLKDENEEEEIDSLDEEQLSGLILMEFIDNEEQWFEELQEIIVPDDVAEFVEEDQFEELKKQLEEETYESSDESTDEEPDEEPEEESEEQPEEEPEDNDEPEPDSILEETGECVEPLQEDLLVDMSGGFQGNQQKKIKQMVLNEDDLYDIQEMIIEIGENLKTELDQVIEEREEEEEQEKEKEDEEEDEKDEMGKEPDGTGPHGRGEGPGKGKADGTGLKKKKDKDEEEDEEDKEEITEQDQDQDNNLRQDIALHIAISIKQGNSPDYALDDARDVFTGQEIEDIIKQYDIQRVWADSKSLEELQQMSDESEITNE